MEDYKPITTPMIISCKLSKEDGAKEVDQSILVNYTSLFYVTTSRKDVMQEFG